MVRWIICGIVLETETNKFLSSIERWRLCACSLFVTRWPTLWISFLFSFKPTVASFKCALEIFVKSECTGNTFIRPFRKETNFLFDPLITHYSPCVEDIHFDIGLKHLFCWMSINDVWLFASHLKILWHWLIVLYLGKKTYSVHTKRMHHRYSR